MSFPQMPFEWQDIHDELVSKWNEAEEQRSLELLQAIATIEILLVADKIYETR